MSAMAWQADESTEMLARDHGVWTSLNSTLGTVIFAFWCFGSHVAG
jgi:hypothetical protein